SDNNDESSNKEPDEIYNESDELGEFYEFDKYAEFDEYGDQITTDNDD
ncbi:10434_t:CDS:1, partial [Cetraspora pellucida]